MRSEVLRCVTDILEGYFTNAMCGGDSVGKEKKREREEDQESSARSSGVKPLQGSENRGGLGSRRGGATKGDDPRSILGRPLGRELFGLGWNPS
jgi:hypothetical protein